MEVPNIKYVSKMREPKTRRRDGGLLTHTLHLGLTTDEAILVSEHFAKAKQEATPSKSFIRLFLLQLAAGAFTETDLLDEMEKWRTRARLAEELSASEVQKALYLLEESKKPKDAKPTAEQKTVAKPDTTAPKKVRREYVPEPRRR